MADYTDEQNADYFHDKWDIDGEVPIEEFTNDQRKVGEVYRATPLDNQFFKIQVGSAITIETTNFTNSDNILRGAELKVLDSFNVGVSFSFLTTDFYRAKKISKRPKYLKLDRTRFEYLVFSGYFGFNQEKLSVSIVYQVRLKFNRGVEFAVGIGPGYSYYFNRTNNNHSFSLVIPFTFPLTFGSK